LSVRTLKVFLLNEKLIGRAEVKEGEKKEIERLKNIGERKI
jgi:hypothetical protein